MTEKVCRFDFEKKCEGFLRGENFVASSYSEQSSIWEILDLTAVCSKPQDTERMYERKKMREFPLPKQLSKFLFFY